MSLPETPSDTFITSATVVLVPTGLTTYAGWSYSNQILSRIKVAWNPVNNVLGYRLRYRKQGETDWRMHSRIRNIESRKTSGNNQYNNCTGVPAFQNEGEAEEGPGVEDGEIRSDGDLVWCLRENGGELKRAADYWPPMWEADGEEGTFPRARMRVRLLDQGQRYEFQAASCTTLSCENNSGWSSSVFTTAARRP